MSTEQTPQTHSPTAVAAKDLAPPPVPKRYFVKFEGKSVKAVGWETGRAGWRVVGEPVLSGGASSRETTNFAMAWEGEKCHKLERCGS